MGFFSAYLKFSYWTAEKASLKYITLMEAHSAVLDPEEKSLNCIFPTKYVIPKSLKFGHWLSEEGKEVQEEFVSINHHSFCSVLILFSLRILVPVLSVRYLIICTNIEPF